MTAGLTTFNWKKLLGKNRKSTRNFQEHKHPLSIMNEQTGCNDRENKREFLK